MAEQAAMGSPRAWARVCGAFYLVTFGASMFGEYYVRPGLVVRDNAAATANNIMASEELYRVGLATDLLGIAAYVGVTALLYVLLRPVSRNVALIAAFSSIAGIAVGAVSLGCNIAPLFLLSGAKYLSGFTTEQLQGLSLLSMKLRGELFTVGMVFFGMYCIVTGALIARSRFFPRLIGVVLAAGGVGYLIDVFTTLLNPALSLQLYPYTYLTGFAGEAALMLWLLLVGVNPVKWEAQSHASPPKGLR